MATRTEHVKLSFNELIYQTNVRTDYGNLEELSNSIAENGVIQPMEGYKQKDGLITKYVITDGHRRFRAIEYGIKKGKIDPEVLKIELIPIPVPSEEKRYLGFILHNDGKRLTMLEEATVLEKLMSIAKYDAKEYSKKTGKSITHVNNLILLLSAEKDLKDLIIKGTVKASLVIELLKDGKTSADIVASVKGAVAKKNGGNAIEDEEEATGTSSTAGADGNVSETKKAEENANTKGSPKSELKEDKATNTTKISKKDLAPKEDKGKLLKVAVKDLESDVQEMASTEGIKSEKMDVVIAYLNYLKGELTLDEMKQLLS